ncbi:hypothetical protein EJ02DRAFT_470525 [Clathrospora elynae]|uniref:Uncharacterized protein n=1 Tax=Clathrospora elynae TaxID=706981 RepID=A0A6A5S9P7_9PLEO|nr:hypothetical protein EJ02DRAFT_470525 [Clathrospora elynae]
MTGLSIEGMNFDNLLTAPQQHNSDLDIMSDPTWFFPGRRLNVISEEGDASQKMNTGPEEPPPQPTSVAMTRNPAETVTKMLHANLPLASLETPEKTFFFPPGQSERLVTVGGYSNIASKAFFSGWLQVNVFCKNPSFLTSAFVHQDDDHTQTRWKLVFTLSTVLDRERLMNTVSSRPVTDHILFSAAS